MVAVKIAPCVVIGRNEGITRGWTCGAVGSMLLAWGKYLPSLTSCVTHVENIFCLPNCNSFFSVLCIFKRNPGKTNDKSIAS